MRKSCALFFKLLLCLTTGQYAQASIAKCPKNYSLQSSGGYVTCVCFNDGCQGDGNGHQLITVPPTCPNGWHFEIALKDSGLDYSRQNYGKCLRGEGSSSSESSQSSDSDEEDAEFEE